MRSTSYPNPQHFILGFEGVSLEPGHWVLEALAQKLIGGVILFDRNIESPKQLTALCQQLKAAKARWIAIDQEGGHVARLRPDKGFIATSTAGALGEKDDVHLTRQEAEATAAQLAKLGIHLNLAPVVDLALQPKQFLAKKRRCYGYEVDRVVKHARAVVEANRKHGVRCVLKHFPGHGSAQGDTHEGLVDVSACWTAKELEPFQRLIASGHADAIMAAHIWHEEWQEAASLSTKVLQELLRKQLGFQGLIISDDLDMGAIRSQAGRTQAAIRAWQAGVDLLIFANHENDAIQELAPLYANKETLHGRS